MKKFFVLYVLLIGIINGWFCYVSPFIQINPNNPLKFNHESGFAVNGSHIYITFIEKTATSSYVKLGVSNNYGASFNYCLVDTVSMPELLPAPSLVTGNDGTCLIYYVKRNYQTSNNDLYSVKYENGILGESSFISEGMLASPKVCPIRNNTFLAFRKYDLSTIFSPGMINFSEFNKGNYAKDCEYVIDPNCKIDLPDPNKLREVFTPLGTDVTAFENKIIKINMEGTSALVRILDFSQTHIDTFTIYSRYPDSLHPVVPGDSSSYIGMALGYNVITIRDTLWGEPQVFDFSNKLIYLPGVVWIEGNVSGKMYFYCTNNVFITGNLTYSGTVPGDNLLYNRNDFLSLLAHGNITLKYKYREPIGNNQYITHYENSQGPDGHVYVYGSLVALGASEGEINSFNNGALTYEYQHPHGAVMPYWGVSQYTGTDTLYSFIDLHRHKMIAPGTSNSPLWTHWPNSGQPTHGYPNGYLIYENYCFLNTNPLYGTSDWPWYNPVWPEKDSGPLPQNPETDITWERGSFHFTGSLISRQRPSLHSNGISGQDIGIWNYPTVLGPPHNLDGYGSTGYEYDLNLDYRLHPSSEFNQSLFSSFPINFDYYGYVLSNQNTFLNSQIFYTSFVIENIKTDSFENNTALVYFDFADMMLHIQYSLDSGLTFDSTMISIEGSYIDFKYLQNMIKILTLNENVFILYTFDPVTHNLSSEVFTFDYSPSVDSNFECQLLKYSNNLLIYFQNYSGGFIYSLNNPVNLEILESIESSSYSFAFGEADTLYIISNSGYDFYDESFTNSRLSFAKAYITGVTPNEDHPSELINPLIMNCYPNPFNPSLNIELTILLSQEIEINLYNIKGQKVNYLFKGSLEKGKHKFHFNANSNINKELASGIYFVRIKGNKSNLIQKVILLK